MATMRISAENRKKSCKSENYLFLESDEELLADTQF